jgi:hypothetical protein
MNDGYDLWDVDTGNNLGHFASEADALERVRILLDTYGDAYADDLQLGGQAEEGHLIPPLAGAKLAQRAREALSGVRG